MAYPGQIYHHDESDADDEYERSILSPTAETHFTPSSPTDSDDGRHSNQHTPTYAGKSPKEAINKWSIKQCADFIASLSLEQYNEAFIEEEIDGEALVALQQDDLKDLGVASVGHRLTILKAVYEIKATQNVPMESDHYVPPSADANAPDANATQDDVARIIKQIQLRDERLRECEAELQRFQEMFLRFQEDHRKFREDVLPLARMAKDKSAPLPTPDGLDATNPLSPPPTATLDSSQPKGLVRKRSRKNFLNNMKIPSPTIQDGSHHLEASAAALAASNHLTASMSSQGNSSPHMSQQPSPTSPHYQTIGSTHNSRTNLGEHVSNAPYRDRVDMNSSRQRTTPTTATHPLTATTTNASQTDSSNTVTTPSTSQAPTSNSSSKGGGESETNNFMKSFRVSLDEPCHKVLPVALKKYNIADDWRQYSLYIVHGDQERCLGLEEKPLILFKQLANEGKKPMFMLRKHASPSVRGFETGPQPGSNSAGGAGGSSGAGSSSMSSSGGVVQQNGIGGPSGAGGGGGGTFRQSYASGMHLPGGVL